MAAIAIAAFGCGGAITGHLTRRLTARDAIAANEAAEPRRVIEALNETVERMSAELANLATRANTAEQDRMNDRAASNAQLQRVQAELDQAREQIASLTLENQASLVQAKMLQEQVAAQQAEIETLNAKVAALEEEKGELTLRLSRHEKTCPPHEGQP